MASASTASAAGKGTSLEDLIELEHVIGYTGKHKASMQLHPSVDGSFVYGLGSNVTLADLADPHNQIFLRGHNAEVSSLELGPGGRLVASGQIKSPMVSSADTRRGIVPSLLC